MCKKVVLIITSCDPKQITEHERILRRNYLSRTKEISLNFMYKNPDELLPALSKKIAERVKEKKVKVVIYDDMITVTEIVPIQSQVATKNPFNIPIGIHISSNKINGDMSTAKDHEECGELLMNLLMESPAVV